MIEAPETADDAALVPITVRVPPHVGQRLKSLTLFIDKNPDPKDRHAYLRAGCRQRRRAAASRPAYGSRISPTCGPCS